MCTWYLSTSKDPSLQYDVGLRHINADVNHLVVATLEPSPGDGRLLIEVINISSSLTSSARWWWWSSWREIPGACTWPPRSSRGRTQSPSQQPRKPTRGGSEELLNLWDIYNDIQCNSSLKVNTNKFSTNLVASSISQEHRYSFKSRTIFLTRYLTGLIPPPTPHTLSRRTRPCFMLSSMSARHRAFTDSGSLTLPL